MPASASTPPLRSGRKRCSLPPHTTSFSQTAAIARSEAKETKMAVTSATELSRLMGHPLLDQLKERLLGETETALASIPHVDRICFRVKSISTFLEKADDHRTEPPYA